MFLMSGTRWVEILAAAEKGPVRNSTHHGSAGEIQDRAWILAHTVDLPIPIPHSPILPKNHSLCDGPDFTPSD